MRPRHAVTLVAVLTILSVACSPGTGDSTSSTSASLEIQVTLPTKLGGDVRITHYTEHAPAKRVFSLGLVAGPPKTPPRSTLHAQGMGNDLPASVDLSQYSPAPGNQGGYGSCASWATGYSTMGWWLDKMGVAANPMNPVFIYSQLMANSGQQCGPDAGSAIEDALALMKSEGDDTLADFPSTQCAQATQAQTQNAGQYRITGFEQGDLSGGAQQAIMQTLASGQPAAIAIWAYDELMNADAQSYYVGPPGPNSKLYGGHAVSAQMYDDKGVWILNSWGDWGYQGWAELSWDFVNGTTTTQGNTYGNVWDIATIDGLAGGGGGGGGCTFTCGQYGYSEGQCVQGWDCQNGCITYDGCQ
jgi:C1A family cysteine protease